MTVDCFFGVVGWAVVCLGVWGGLLCCGVYVCVCVCVCVCCGGVVCVGVCGGVWCGGCVLVVSWGADAPLCMDVGGVCVM